MNWSGRHLLLPMLFSSYPVLPHKVESLSVDSASVKIGSRSQMFLKIKEACACPSSSQPFSSQHLGEKPHGAAYMHTDGLRLAMGRAPLCERYSRLRNKKFPKDDISLSSIDNIKLQVEVPQKISKKSSSQCLIFLSQFVFSFYSCICVLPPMAATLELP